MGLEESRELRTKKMKQGKGKNKAPTISKQLTIVLGYSIPSEEELQSLLKADNGCFHPTPVFQKVYPGTVPSSELLRSCHFDKIYSFASFPPIPVHVQDTAIVSSWLDGKCRNLSRAGRSVLVSKILHWCFLSRDLVCHSQLISPIPQLISQTKENVFFAPSMPISSVLSDEEASCCCFLL